MNIAVSYRFCLSRADGGSLGLICGLWLNSGLLEEERVIFRSSSLRGRQRYLELSPPFSFFILLERERLLRKQVSCIFFFLLKIQHNAKC